MRFLVIFLILVLAIQVALFFLGRKWRKDQKENDILYKYRINNRQELWQKIADPETPEEDRKRLQAMYDEQEH